MDAKFNETTQPLSNEPHMRFWAAINDFLVHRAGLPEIPYADARELWEQTTREAAKRAREGMDA